MVTPLGMTLVIVSCNGVRVRGIVRVRVRVRIGVRVVMFTT